MTNSKRPTLIEEINHQLASTHKYLDRLDAIHCRLFARNRRAGPEMEATLRALHECYGAIRQLEHLVQYEEKVLAKGRGY